MSEFYKVCGACKTLNPCWAKFCCWCGKALKPVLRLREE